jgi:hypothetical protein
MTQIPNRPIRMRASEYGIKKLKTILPNLLEWSKEDGESLELDELYGTYRTVQKIYGPRY